MRWSVLALAAVSLVWAAPPPPPPPQPTQQQLSCEAPDGHFARFSAYMDSGGYTPGSGYFSLSQPQFYDNYHQANLICVGASLNYKISCVGYDNGNANTIVELTVEKHVASYRFVHLDTNPYAEPAQTGGQWPCKVIVSPANSCTEAVRPVCSKGFHAIFQDQHDGDQKEVSIEKSNELIIRPYANTDTWEVRTGFDPSSCVAANVDFNVPGKPSPPPFNLTLTIFTLADEACTMKAAAVFTTNTSSTFPLNTWVEIKQSILEY